MSYTNKTEHYGIPLPIREDGINLLDWNESSETIDKTLYESSQATDTLKGDIDNVKTDIDGLKAEDEKLEKEIASISGSNAEYMICDVEVVGDTFVEDMSNGSYFRHDGDLYKLKTNVNSGESISNENSDVVTVGSRLISIANTSNSVNTKTNTLSKRIDNIDSDISSVNKNINTINSNIGTLEKLKTTDKSNLVCAINEVCSSSFGYFNNITNIKGTLITGIDGIEVTIPNDGFYIIGISNRETVTKTGGGYGILYLNDIMSLDWVVIDKFDDHVCLPLKEGTVVRWRTIDANSCYAIYGELTVS